MISRIASTVAVTLLAGLIFGCSKPDAPAPQKAMKDASNSNGPETSQSPALQYLPRGSEVEGWDLDKDPQVIPASRIDSYLGVDATHFLEYDVVDLTVGNYRRTRGDGFATVQIFRFPDFIKAFGAYSTRRSAVVSFLDVTNESFVGPHSIHIWRGAFYIRMTGGGAAGLIDPMKDLASAVVEGMPEAESKPAIFEFLPSERRIVNSERYLAGPALGQPYLANAFTAEYEVGDGTVEGLAIPATNREDAKKILDAFRSFYASSGRLLDPVPNLGEDNFTGEDRYMGRVVAFRLDRFVIAFNGFAPKPKLVDLAAAADENILRAIRRQLRSD